MSRPEKSRHAAVVNGECFIAFDERHASRPGGRYGIEKAKRLVEHKRDVVILLDSLTPWPRLTNAVVPPSAKSSSGV